MILYVAKVTNVTKIYNFRLLRLPNGDEIEHLGTSWYKMVIKWCSMVHNGAKLL